VEKWIGQTQKIPNLAVIGQQGAGVKTDLFGKV
jgi:hypothetical protein